MGGREHGAIQVEGGREIPYLMPQHLIKLFLGYGEAFPVCTVHHQQKKVCAGVIGAPSLPQ